MSYEDKDALLYLADVRIDELDAENAKLRELVRDMCKAFIHGPCYRWCEHMPEPCNGDKCQYVRRMHETYKKTEDEMEGASRE